MSAIAADRRDGDGGHEDVVVLHVRQLVRDDALELDAVHLLEQAGRDRQGRVLGVPAGRERFGGGVVDHVQAGLREPGCDAQALDEVVVAAVLGPSAGFARLAARRDAVGEPVRAPGHRDRDDDGDRHDRVAELEEVSERGHHRGDQHHEDEEEEERPAPLCAICCTGRVPSARACARRAAWARVGVAWVCGLAREARLDLDRAGRLRVALEVLALSKLNIPARTLRGKVWMLLL